MEKEFNVVVERDECGYYIGSVPELPGCHTQAKSLDGLVRRMKEAIELYLEVEKEKEKVPTKPLKFFGIQKIAVSL
ncbi:MAG TPA: type II toxin-antitoxin system HicB family antitoxin [Thermoplasmata archaeon]|nr:type II toxin-antitoxin system HicB family antitoxin [Thermoplasmata archaeon]